MIDVPQRGFGEVFHVSLADDPGVPIKRDDDVVMVIRGKMAHLGLKIEKRDDYRPIYLDAPAPPTNWQISLGWSNRDGEGPWFYLQRETATGEVEPDEDALADQFEQERADLTVKVHKAMTSSYIGPPRPMLLGDADRAVAAVITAGWVPGPTTREDSRG